MRLAVTRPLPDGERTAEALRARGHDVTLAPVMRIEPVAADLSGKFSAVVITSANAARAAATTFMQHAARAKLPVFAVGARSAEAARAAGLADVSSAEGAAADLARLIASRCNRQGPPLLYLAGEERTGDLPGQLRKSGFAVTTAVVYRAIALPLTPQLAAALAADAIDGVLHFSARSAAFYIEAANAAGLLQRALQVRHFCLSAAVGAPLHAAGAEAVAISTDPDERALLDCVEP